MAFKIIPITTDQNQIIPVTLEGVSYELQLLYNLRSDSWSLNVFNASGDLLAGSIKAVVNFPLLKYFTDLELPTGDLYFWDQSGSNTDPGRNDLGTRVLLVYKEAE
jgi:hypothetical protein